MPNTFTASGTTSGAVTIDTLDDILTSDAMTLLQMQAVMNRIDIKIINMVANHSMIDYDEKGEPGHSVRYSTSLRALMELRDRYAAALLIGDVVFERTQWDDPSL